MIHPTLTRVIAIVMAGTLTVGLAAPSFAQGGQPPAQQECREGKSGQNCPSQGDGQHGGQQGSRDHGQPQGQHQDQARGPQQQPGQHGRDTARQMQQLTQDQRHRLPEPPKGQSYRRQGDQVVRVDDNTGAVIAVLGLAAVLLANQ